MTTFATTSNLSPSPPASAGGASTPRPQVEFLNSRQAAALMKISQSTLRNYVWLLSLPRKERQHRFLQDPPTKMPKPQRHRGRLRWASQPFYSWLDTHYLPNKCETTSFTGQNDLRP